MKDEVYFLPADKHQMFLQNNTIFLGFCGQHAQITQNNKFAICLQYLKREESDEFDFFAGR